jgi:hypothetical protein
MLPLPGGRYDPADPESLSVGRNALVRVAGAWYSVPSSWQGCSILGRCGAEDVTFTQGDQQVTHLRVSKGERSIWYPHYLPELMHKPNALAQVAPLLMPQLGAPFGPFWQRLIEQTNRLTAARLCTRVLQRIQQKGLPEVTALIQRLMQHPTLELSAFHENEPEPAAVLVPASLAQVEVVSTGLAHFDQLLGGGA